MVSTETEKRKRQIRDKVNEYIAYRHSLGNVPKNVKKMTFGGEDEEFEGDIIDELGLIEGQEK